MAAESITTSQQASEETEMEVKDEKQDSSPIESEPERQTPLELAAWRPDSHFYLAIISIGAGTFLSGISTTSFLVIIPNIAFDIPLSSVEAFWLPTASNICFVLSSFFTGPLSNVFGRRPLIILQILLNIPGSILSGAAKNFATILAGRCFVGFGGGLVVLSEICITDMVPLSQRGRFMSFIMMPWVVGNMIGPIVAGGIADNTTWRWALYFLAPIAGICAVLYFMFLRLQTPRLSLTAIRKFDFLGAAVFAGAAISLVIGISWGGIVYPWGAWQTIVPIVIGVATLGGFLIYEWKLAGDPLIQLGMLKQRTMWITCCGNLFYGITFVQILYLLPYYFMGCKGMSVLGAGVATLAFQVPIFIASGVFNPLMTRTASYRWCILLGFSFIVLGFGLYTMLKPSTHTAAWIFIIAVPGLGIGALTMSQSYAVQAAAHHSKHDVGRALSLQWMLRTFGNCLGLSIGGSALRNFLVKKSRDNPLLAPQADHYGADASALATYIVGLEDSGSEGVLKKFLEIAYASALQDVWYIVLGLTGAILILSLGTQALSLDQVLVTSQPLVARTTTEPETEST